MRKYHHVGIPTTTRRKNESYIPGVGVHHSGFETSPYGIEWMRFDTDSPLPDLVKTVAHVAFEVDDMESELADKEILIEPNSPSKGVTVAFIVDNGAPVEFVEFSGEEDPIEE